MEAHDSTEMPVLQVSQQLDGVRLRKNVVPGDQLRIEVETVRLKASNAEIAARATVDGQIVCEANMRFMLSDGPG